MYSIRYIHGAYIYEIMCISHVCASQYHNNHVIK